MRAEKRKKYVITMMSMVLLALAPLSYLRVLLAVPHLRDTAVGAVSGVYSTVTDRNDQVIFQGHNLYESVYGNLLGQDSLIDNSLHSLYQDELKVKGFNPLTGISSISEKNRSTLKTTLLSQNDMQKIITTFGEYEGCVFAYDYVTGEVLVALSVPSSLDETATSTGMWNRCLRTCYIPGSTMKIVAAACALEQNPDLLHAKFTCTGSTKLPDTSVVKCHGVHGAINLSDALGYSCNCYMANLISQLDVTQTQILLEQMGIAQHGNQTYGHIDKLTYRGSSTTFDSTDSFDSVWSLIGQGNTQSNPVGMAMIAAAVVNHGETATPYLVASIQRGNRTTYTAQSGQTQSLLKANTSHLLSEIWRSAVDAHYRSGSNQMDNSITHAKSGTAQLGDGTHNRFMMGVMEDSHVAFFIAVEKISPNNNLPAQIANVLANILK